MNKSLKYILVVIIIAIVLFCGYVYYIFSSFSFGSDKVYSKKELIDNYKKRSDILYSLKNYYNRLVPSDKIVEIEFENDKEIARLAVTNLKPSSSNYSDQYFCDWNLGIHSKQVDSVIQSLKWKRETLTEIKSWLDKANCIGIINGEPTNIWFQRSGFGMYSYEIFSNPISDTLKSNYNDSCRYIFYNDKVVLEYGGGAVGPQCFPDED
ncbi:MAG: hypothetical protein QM737_18595 [Ferruginibacter sp.]